MCMCVISPSRTNSVICVCVYASFLFHARTLWSMCKRVIFPSRTRTRWCVCLFWCTQVSFDVRRSLLFASCDVYKSRVYVSCIWTSLLYISFICTSLLYVSFICTSLLYVALARFLLYVTFDAHNFFMHIVWCTVVSCVVSMQRTQRTQVPKLMNTGLFWRTQVSFDVHRSLLCVSCNVYKSLAVVSFLLPLSLFSCRCLFSLAVVSFLLPLSLFSCRCLFSLAVVSLFGPHFCMSLLHVSFTGHF